MEATEQPTCHSVNDMVVARCDLVFIREWLIESEVGAEMAAA